MPVRKPNSIQQRHGRREWLVHFQPEPRVNAERKPLVLVVSNRFPTHKH